MLYGLHSLRVEGYNLALRGVGRELTVAHGRWESDAHERWLAGRTERKMDRSPGGVEMFREGSGGSGGGGGGGAAAAALAEHLDPAR